MISSLQNMDLNCFSFFSFFTMPVGAKRFIIDHLLRAFDLPVIDSANLSCFGLDTRVE